MEIIKGILYELLSIFFTYGTLIMYMFLVPKSLHYMQLEGYKNSDFMRWFTKNPKLAFKSNLGQLIVVAIYYLVITIINYFVLEKLSINNAILILAIEYIGILLLFYVSNISQALKDKKERKNAKKLLVYTARAKRLMFWNFFVALIIVEMAFVKNVGESYTILDAINKILAYSAFSLFIPVNMIIANFLASPTERFVNERYISNAKRKLRKKEYKNLIKIGITGSYRKNKY